MTVSEQQARPPDSPPPGPEWKPIPGAPGYEASHRGKYRSVERVKNGRTIPGKDPLGIRLQNRTRDDDTVYAIGDVVRADGSKWTDTIHSFVLRTHDPDGYFPGAECRHGPGGPLDNRWPENIRWGTKKENEADKPRPIREPKPPRPCINGDGREAVPHGRRCQQCREEIARAAAELFENGADPDQVAKALDYGSGTGVYRLAVTHGGLRVHVGACPAPVFTQSDRPEIMSLLRSVMIRWRGPRRNSDAQ